MELRCFRLTDKIDFLCLASGQIRRRSTVAEYSMAFEIHFPDFSPLHGVLLVEAMTQTIADDVTGFMADARQ